MNPSRAIVLSVMALISGCAGGGDSAPAPAPAPSPAPAPPPPPPPVNTAPKLLTLSISLEEDAVASLQISASDAENDALTFAVVANPQHGTATMSLTGALTYTPTPDFNGTDSLDVRVSDSAGAQTTGTIAITVNALDDAPVVTTTQLAVNEDTVLHSQLAGTDVEGDTFSYVLAFSPTHGNVVMDASGSLTYTPSPDYFGPDEFHVRTHETVTGVESGEQVVHIDVHGVNDAPVAQADRLRVAANGGQAVEIPVLANDTDKDGDTLTPVVLSQPRGGTLTVDAATHKLMFAPANGYVGPIDFTYQATDGVASSNPVTARAVIGDFEGIIFISDYRLPGVPELFVYDGFDVRRMNDDLPAGGLVTGFNVSGDFRLLTYVVEDASYGHVYVKPYDGSGPAVERYRTQLKTPQQLGGLQEYVNPDGSYMVVDDYWLGGAKHQFVVNTATGAKTRVAGNMPDIVDVRYTAFHPFEPNLLMVQLQTAGPVPRDYTAAYTMFLGDASDASTLTQIGRNYAPGASGAGEGIYYGRDPRFVYYAEFLTLGSDILDNMLVYDRVNHTESPVGRLASPPDRGVNGVGWESQDLSRMCLAYYEPTTTAPDGPSRFYSIDLADPTSTRPVTPIYSRTTQCTYASDNRTMIYRVRTPDYVTQLAYAVDVMNPGAPKLLAPAGEELSEQMSWHAAPGAMRIAIAYFDNDGVTNAQGQTGRYYTLPLDGGTPFLFSNTYSYDGYTTYFYDSNNDGSFILYGRPRNGVPSLELMSTHGLNLSIPLSGPGETSGVRRASWLRRWP